MSVKINIHLGFEEKEAFSSSVLRKFRQNEEGVPYPEFNSEDPVKSMYDLQREFYYRQTDRISFSTHDLLYYDIATDTYKIGERMSDYLYSRIYERLPQADKEGFEAFITYYWGLGNKPAGTSINEYHGVEKYSNPAPMDIDHGVYSFDDAIEFLKGYNLE